MNYYQFFPHDQVRNNWLMFTEHKQPPYVRLKARYNACVCPKCQKINHDKAFAEGFDASLQIRAKGDLFATSEGFLCLSEKARLIMESSGFGGVVLKPVSNLSWWVTNVTCRVNADQGAYALAKPLCDECGRPKEVTGLIRCLSQIDPPEKMGVFFSPVFDRGGSMNGDRDVFVTEDIVVQFKRQGIKGGMFARLFTIAEFERVRASGAEKNPLKWPRDSRIVL